MKKILFSLLALLASINIYAQTRLTENTLRIDKNTKISEVNMSDLYWFEGIWEGEAFGGKVKEVWTNAGGGVLIGTFALIRENKPVFYEFLTISKVENELFLRLKHFNPDMTGWEEKDKYVTFRFIKKEGNRIYFRGLTFEKDGADGLNIFLALREKGQDYKEEVFRLRRSH